ncbi:hypothetical protein Droror1_Dr00014576 [Drosera rotundifolia]
MELPPRSDPSALTRDHLSPLLSSHLFPRLTSLSPSLSDVIFSICELHLRSPLLFLNLLTLISGLNSLDAHPKFKCFTSMLIPIRPNASSDECRVNVERKRGGGLGVEDLGGACEGRKMRDLEYLMQVEVLSRTKGNEEGQRSAC